MLLSASEKIPKNPEIEVQWKKFNSEIETEIEKLNSEIKIDERTQASRDLYHEVSQFILKANTSQEQKKRELIFYSSLSSFHLT